MFERLLGAYAYVFARPSFKDVNHFLIMVGLRGIGVLNYRTPTLSGENLVAKNILKEIDHENSVVLDVGANEGDFTDLVLRNSKHVRVMSFEPHPETASRLRSRFTSSRVEIIDRAVGNARGVLSLFDYHDRQGSDHASLFKGVIEDTHGGVAKEHSVEVITLDSLKIADDVDLIKVDVEGFELPVLLGSKELIEHKRPKYLIIEFNEMNVNANTFLKDILDVLKGYSVYRILPMGRLLELNKPYRAWTHEIFAYQNLLFKRSDVD
jgi:FkbM family methyltransferase